MLLINNDNIKVSIKILRNLKDGQSFGNRY